MSEFSPGIQKVLDHVARTSGWFLLPQCKALRRDKKRIDCPLESMTRRVQYDHAAQDRFGLTREEVQFVIDAADGGDPSYPELRAALLKAARLA